MYFFLSLSLEEFFNRPGVAGAVLQSPLSLINSFIHLFSNPVPPNLQNIIKGEPKKTRPPEIRKYSKSKMCIPRKLKLPQPVYLIR